jgi:anti-sigma regulatory factor (Ser/Thr protein kinase)
VGARHCLSQATSGHHCDVVETPSRNAGTPFTVALRLEPRSDAAGIARRFVHDNRDHIDADVVENAELLVSEIVTNALRHGAGDIILTMRVDPPGIGVRVTDTGERLPVVASHAPSDDQGSGRGLLIVDAISSEWGVSQLGPSSGKTVWFDVRPEE